MLAASVLSRRSSASLNACASDALHAAHADHPVTGQDRNAQPGQGVGATDVDRTGRILLLAMSSSGQVGRSG